MCIRDSAGAAAREGLDAGGVELHAVGVPDIGAQPAQVFGVLGRGAGELLARVGDVAVVLGQMGVQLHAVYTRQQRGVSHQPAADAERRARRHHDALERCV